MLFSSITSVLVLVTGVVARRSVLFITNDELGQAGIHIATSQSIAERYPNVDVHVASFAPLKNTIKELSSRLAADQSSPREVTFHTVRGLSPASTIRVTVGKGPDDYSHTPGIRAGLDFGIVAGPYTQPWNSLTYHEIFESITDIINKVDPTVILIDVMLPPAVCAAQELDRPYMLFTPYSVKEVVLSDMGLAGLYKYPA